MGLDVAVEQLVRSNLAILAEEDVTGLRGASRIGDSVGQLFGTFTSSSGAR